MVVAKKEFGGALELWIFLVLEAGHVSTMIVLGVHMLEVSLRSLAL